MNDHVKVSVESDDSLRRVTWRFWFHRGQLVLDAYCIETRASRRRNYKVESSYERLALSRSDSLKESDVPLPDAIREQAIRAFTANIVVVRWSDVKGSQW